MFLANWSNGANILFTIITLLIISGLGVALFFSFKKEKKNYRNEVAGLVEGVLKRNEIISSVNSYISKSPNSLVFSLILIDYDKLIEIQNAFGDNNCKKVLTESIKNVRKVLPNRALIGRLSEERFIVLVKEDYDKNETLRCANKICEAASLGVKVYSDTLVNPTVSIGVTFYPHHGRNMKQLLKSLDLAVFNCKNQGGNGVVIYSDEFDKNDNENLQLYYEIKQAIKERQFCLYYQPIINLNENKIYGFEALLRWKHPSLGILYPASFINILEQSGDINAVGIWGIEALIREYIELKKEFIHKDLQLSFNLSPKQLISDTLGVTFQNIAKKYKISVSSITIEIVEFAMFEKHEIVYKNISDLKDLGFKVAVDGVGLDQNTLIKLSQSPIDIIKLDKSFFDYEDSFVQDKYIELLVDIAKKSNKQIICEGIENYELLKKISKFGIEYAQGYYFSKPIPQEDVVNYISNEGSLEMLINPTKNTEVAFDLEENIVSLESEEISEGEEEILESQNTEEVIEESLDSQSIEEVLEETVEKQEDKEGNLDKEEK